MIKLEFPYYEERFVLKFFITSNHRQTGVNGVWVLICEGAIVNRIELMHDDDWAFTSMDAKNGSPTFHTWGLKSIQ